MNTFLIIRDGLRNAYANFAFIIRPIIKFLIAFVFLIMIQNYIGHVDQLSDPKIICAASAVCMIFPYGFIAFLCGVFVIINMFKVSLVMTTFTVLLFVFIGMLYFGFKPKTGIVIAVVPIFFMLKLPYIVPVILGMSAGIFSAIPAALGVIVWFTIRYFHDYAEEMTRFGDPSAMIKEFIDLAETIMKDKYMLLIIAAFILCIALVHLISSSSMDHAWTIAVTVGVVALALVMAVGGSLLGEGSFLGDIIGLIVTLLLALLYEFSIYGVDYRATEHLQFDDDDYYYYVKAVPKLRSYDGQERKE